MTNLVLKSGTNQFHGEAYFVKTPRSMFANDFFANANNIPLTDFSYTRWAASGPFGPDSSRNQTFFTYGYESHSRSASAQQRHAQCADREDAQRRLLRAARARIVSTSSTTRSPRG